MNSQPRHSTRVMSGSGGAGLVAALPPLREGDVVFIATPNYLYRQIAAATGSPASHVGVVLADGDGGWWVAESAVPRVRVQPLERFVRRSEGGWLAVRRLPVPLSAPQSAALRAACDRRQGQWYHTGFDIDSRHRTFCSRFVREVYLEALGLELGEAESFGELLARTPQEGLRGRLRFWRLWFFGRIPWSRRTVTPASQFDSPLLTTVYRSDRTGGFTRPAAGPSPVNAR